MGIAMASRASAGTGVGPGASRYRFSIETSFQFIRRWVVTKMKQGERFSSAHDALCVSYVFAVV
jgi:hypothetical protein